MTELTLSLVFVLLLSFVTASISYALEYWMMPEHILSRYGKWVRSWDNVLSMPMGACTMCLNVWVTLIVSSWFIFRFDFLTWDYLLYIVVVSQFWLRKVMV